MPLERMTIVVQLTNDVEDGPPIYLVSSPEVRGLITESETLSGALEMAADAIRGLGKDERADGQEITAKRYGSGPFAIEERFNGYLLRYEADTLAGVANLFEWHQQRKMSEANERAKA